MALPDAFSALPAGAAAFAGGRSGSSEAAFTGFLWLAGLVFAAVVVAVGLLALRRRFNRDADTEEPVFTLEELRRLKERGELTDAEYKELRRRTLERR